MEWGGKIPPVEAVEAEAKRLRGLARDVHPWKREDLIERAEWLERLCRQRREYEKTPAGAAAAEGSA